jgi:uncharacterized membrane protein YqjE
VTQMPTGSHAATPSETGAATGGTAEDTRSLGSIVGDITTDLSTLVRQEMELAKTELKQEISKAGKGAGMLGGAGFAGYMTLLFLSLALTWLLDNWMPLELAALITAVLWGIAAAVLAVTGRKKLQESNPQLPQTQQSLKEDAQWVKAQKS